MELIRTVPLFAGCSKRELAEIASIADEIDLPEGRVLINEGDLGHEFFVLIDGTADVRRRGRKIRTVGPGDWVGEIALLSDTARRTATVTATSPVRTLVIADRQFRALLRRSPEIQLKVLQVVAERLAPETV